MKRHISEEMLTAYVLGEISEADRARVQLALANDPTLRAEANELRSFLEVLSTDLKQEAACKLSDRQKQTLQLEAEHAKGRFPTQMSEGSAASTSDGILARRTSSRLLRDWRIWAPILAACGVAAAIGLFQWKENDSAPLQASQPAPLQTSQPEPLQKTQTAPVDMTPSASIAATPATKNIAVSSLEETRFIPAPSEPARAPAVVAKRAVVPQTAVPKGGVSQELSRQMLTDKSDSGPMTTALLGAPTGARAGLASANLGKNEHDALAHPRSESVGEGPGSFNTEAYSHIAENQFLSPGSNPLSTFSVDVDTASYSNVRRFLQQGTLPPADAVRIEELVNYFPYGYEAPRERPFATNIEVAEAPWNEKHRLVRIGIKGRETSKKELPGANLVFLIDTSGSMNDPGKLPLLQSSLRLLVENLRDNDRVAIVTYAGSAGLVLPSTPGKEKQRIREAIETLRAGGSTNGAAGIELAYQQAVSGFLPKGNNRVILASDGDFNVGTTSEGELIRLVESKAKQGVQLSILGFGMGNIKDATLEKLADKGDGNYAYIDSLQEARKVLVEQMGGTLLTIARDVKLQVEFNPAEVGAYRLLGYENRILAHEDFNNDAKDAGDIGSGHTVTALYEVVPAGIPINVPGIDPLKYQSTAKSPSGNHTGEMMTLKIRYKEPTANKSSLIEFIARDPKTALKNASADFKQAAAVASFGMLLRGSPFSGKATWQMALQLAEEGARSDTGGYRKEFLELIKKARSLQARE